MSYLPLYNPKMLKGMVLEPENHPYLNSDFVIDPVTCIELDQHNFDTFSYMIEINVESFLSDYIDNGGDRGHWVKETTQLVRNPDIRRELLKELSNLPERKLSPHADWVMQNNVDLERFLEIYDGVAMSAVREVLGVTKGTPQELRSKTKAFRVYCDVRNIPYNKR